MLKVLSMMGLVSDERGEVGRAGEFAMEVLEAVQYNTHPIDQVGLLGIFFVHYFGPSLQSGVMSLLVYDVQLPLLSAL